MKRFEQQDEDILSRIFTCVEIWSIVGSSQNQPMMGEDQRGLITDGQNVDVSRKVSVTGFLYQQGGFHGDFLRNGRTINAKSEVSRIGK